MFDTKLVTRIEEFVAVKPRSLQEISQHIGTSWRTADRYVERIGKEFGTIATRTFRGGTRGALKVVYWASVERHHASQFQERLEREVLTFRRKEDFSAFDIYQHVAAKEKRAIVISSESEDKVDIHELISEIERAEKQLLLFSGNLSWVNLKSKGKDALTALDHAVGKGISVKIICRVDLVSLKNIERALSLNFKHRNELIEIRHAEQPVRAFIYDSRFFRIKEIKEPTGKVGELNKRLYIYYLIKDREWTEWLARVFWKLFSNSVDARKRVEELEKLRKA